MLLALGFVFMFTIGGLSGVLLVTHRLISHYTILITSMLKSESILINYIIMHLIICWKLSDIRVSLPVELNRSTLGVEAGSDCFSWSLDRILAHDP